MKYFFTLELRAIYHFGEFKTACCNMWNVGYSDFVINPSKKTCAVIGSGPNGLAAAVRMAQAGYLVTVFETSLQAGGGCITSELTLPGFLHDHCSAIHPLGFGSPYLRTLPLAQFGLDWINPEVALAHPLDNGTAVLLHRSIAATANGLGADANAYTKLFAPISVSVRGWTQICNTLLQPIKTAAHPFGLMKFGADAILSADELVHKHFKTETAKALIAGIAAHSQMPLTRRPSAAFALVLGMLGHSVGWPLPVGGSQQITNSLIDYLATFGGVVQTGKLIQNVNELQDFDIVMADVNAAHLPKLCSDQLLKFYTDQLLKFEPGPGLFKLDYALDGPVPWTAKECALAPTVHLGGTFDEIAKSEQDSASGIHSEQPYVLLAQQSLFDSTRAPQGKHTLWAYCHVPLGSDIDMTSAIENQIERFAPGFQKRILHRTSTRCADFERLNPNFIGGDITGGAYTLKQMIARPTLSSNPWTVPLTNGRKLYLCSASTPPGGGVHGMCGYYAAQSALGELWKP